jgi:hypothetical protein
VVVLVIRTSEHQVALAQALSLSSSFAGSGGGGAGHSGSGRLVEVELLEELVDPLVEVEPEVLGPLLDGPVLDGTVVEGHGSVVVDPLVLLPELEVGSEVSVLDGPLASGAAPAASSLLDGSELLVGSELEVVGSGHGTVTGPGSGLASARPPATRQSASGTDSDELIQRRVFGISSTPLGAHLSEHARSCAPFIDHRRAPVAGRPEGTRKGTFRWSADAQVTPADARQGALGAPALGPVDELDDLATLGLRDGFRPGQVVLLVAVPAGAHDEPDQLGLGRISLTVARGVAEQETGQLRLGVERTMLGETVVEHHDVVHGALLLLHGLRQSTTIAAGRSRGGRWRAGQSVSFGLSAKMLA